jgi:uncharacterized DUF497 family protein
MELEFDTAKDLANITKHVVSLRLGGFILENQVGVLLDRRLDYGEDRYNAFGYIGTRLFVCTYTLRGPVYRVISVRKASRQEQRLWRL